ncbi:hypothetical protein GUI37_01530 [Helcococcus kunzii]|uniref:hypothetical protein n=1 Tax=Helcococcus kunzii TaxID=40091 RepID=UPI001BB03DCB|nr:hypothetical protein [Helcococcus kunzii]QUY64267.1 hypothetical protein GUI37_01530 [Helcococcus kunzii]
MSKWYYFNKNTDINGYHEIHSEDCKYLPDYDNRELIGFCKDCKEAINKAQTEYSYKKFDGCYFCSTSCHKW